MRYNVVMQGLEKIYVEKAAAGTAAPFLEGLHGVPVEYIASRDELRPNADRHGTLFLARLKGAALKPFRSGYPDGVAFGDSNEFAVRHALSCPYDCTYCYLQTYEGCETPTIFVNRRDILDEVEAFLDSHDERVTLLAGHLSETLPLFGYDSFFRDLCGLVRRFPKNRLEVRTKSAEVGVYDGIEPALNIIPSWTLSPDIHRQRYEKWTPSIAKRLEAMAELQEKGWSVGVRLDPVVRDELWENAYRELIEEIFETLDAERIRDIHIGALRYVPELGDIIRERDPRSPLTLGEQFLAPDGKIKYARPLRIEMYRKLVSMISDRARIVLVMEPPEVAEAVLGF